LRSTLLVILVFGIFCSGGRATGRLLEVNLEDLGKALMMLLEELEGAQRFYAGGVFCCICELASGARMFIYGDGSLGGVGGFGCGFGMVARLRGEYGVLASLLSVGHVWVRDIPLSEARTPCWTAQRQHR